MKSNVLNKYRHVTKALNEVVEVCANSKQISLLLNSTVFSKFYMNLHDRSTVENEPIFPGFF